MTTTLSQMPTAYTLTNAGEEVPFLITTDLGLFTSHLDHFPEATVGVLTYGIPDEDRTEILLLNV
jgi:hypothetical protein